MTGSARVLTGLMERRALEAAFAQLAETTSLDQLVERARAIAEHGLAAAPLLISLLDTPDPQLRGGLGQVAAQLDPETIVPMLKAAARSRDRSDQARLTALMILQRFLHQPVDEALLAGLQDPDTVAAQSLRELVHEMERNQFVVIEYLNQLAEQPPDVAQTVLDVIPRLPLDQHLLTLLRMFAQGEDRRLAQIALDQMGRARSVEAARALLTLSATLPPQQAAAAARIARKLRLSGVPEAEPSIPADQWRALLSPVDGTGAQVVWFVRNSADGQQGALLSLLIREPEGIAVCFGSLEVPSEDLPPAQETGNIYIIQQTADAPAITLLEVPFEAGRRVVRQGLELNWASENLPPLEYRLLNHLIWEHGPIHVEPVEDGTGEPDGAVKDRLAKTAALLDHPSMTTWFWQTPEAYDVAHRLGRRLAPSMRSSLIADFAVQHFSPEVLMSYQRRLKCTAQWLRLAGQAEVADLAEAARRQLVETPPSDNPFVRRLIGQGIDVAAANLRSGLDLRRHSGAWPAIV